MKRWVALFLCVAWPVMAEPANEAAALGQEVLECVAGKVGLRGRIMTLEAELAKLRKAEAEAPKPP